MQELDEFRDHPIYEKFKSMYPDSDEKYTLHNEPSIHMVQHDSHGNTLSFGIYKWNGTEPYFFYVTCDRHDQWNDEGAMLEDTFDFLDSYDCLNLP